MSRSALRGEIRACALVAFYLVSDWLREGHEKWRLIIKHTIKAKKVKSLCSTKNCSKQIILNKMLSVLVIFDAGS